ncbi:hypothetical protein [Rhodococcus sp. UYP9]
METMTKLSTQLRELGQDDWADELEKDADRRGLEPLAFYDDRRAHPAPFIAGTAVVVSCATLLLATLGIAIWPGVARTVALVSFVLIALSFMAWFRTSTSASNRRELIVNERLRGVRSSR